MNCSICGYDHFRKKFDCDTDRKIFICLNCKVQFLHPQLNDDELSRLYAENYYLAWGVQGTDENKSTRLMKMETFRLRLSLIRKFVGSGKVLDVGCATGYFLEEAREQGFDAYGVEFSEYSSQIAKKLFGEDHVFKGTLEQSEFANDMFDVISMSDLIEHVKSPVDTLSKASKLLKDDGVIMIMTPDSGSLSNKLMGRRWSHYKLEHFFYFDEVSMKVLAEKCNLRLVHEEKSKKALNIDYLYTQFRVYQHWLFTPLFSILHFILPEKICSLNFYISLGEMVVILKKKQS
jgi:2-polyprenyl-3-methyl-5-hydroxy-6-metoxy-1,4-benzoquinol methylase